MTGRDVLFVRGMLMVSGDLNPGDIMYTQGTSLGLPA